jgi:hypothetical protein
MLGIESHASFTTKQQQENVLAKQLKLKNKTFEDT